MPDRTPGEAAGKPAGLDAWLKLVESDGKRDASTLRSYSHDGIAIEPLYKRRTDTVPIVGRESRSWKLVQIVDDPDPDRANAQALRDLSGGATGLALRFAGAPSAAGSGLPPTTESLSVALAGVDFAAIHLRIDPHASCVETARLVSEMIARSGLAPESADVASGLDAIGPAVFAGIEAVSASPFVQCFKELRSTGYKGALAELDARVFHEAGATEAQELGVVLAEAVWWLRALEAAGEDCASAVGYFGASLAVDRDQFMSIAKLRAVRLLWARLLEVCGFPSAPLHVHAETSRRMMTRANAEGNLLRTTIAAFSAATGGADSITVLPHTAALGLPDRSARTLARNAQHLLRDESHLHIVTDPAAGSGAVEALTDALCERGWAEFQAIESEGGIVESIRTGAFTARISKAREMLAKDLRGGRSPLVGATIYAAPEEAAAAQAPEVTHAGVLSQVRLEDLAVAPP